MQTKKDGGVNAPISLGDLFNNDSGDEEQQFENEYENQSLMVGDRNLIIRQSSWHQTNANKVWPGTFLLADFIISNCEYKDKRFKNQTILELGSATGLF